MDTLERERTAKVAALRELDQAADPASDPGLLDALPTTTIDWNEVPAEFQRDLFDALQVHIRYDRTTNTAHGQVTLVGDTGTRVPDAIRADVKQRAGQGVQQAVE
jgi:hypothetical protein